MNFKRILSSALTVVMVFAAIVTALPATVKAAHSQSSVTTGGKTLTTEEIKAVVQSSYESNYNDAQQMLEADLEAGYLDSVSSSGDEYTLYVNRYTGMVYYVNNETDQILTSNPSNVGYGSPMAVSIDRRKQLMSQVSVSFVPVGSSSSDEIGRAHV